MYLIMVEGDLRIEVNNHRIRINEGEWKDIPPNFRHSTIRVSAYHRVFMWRGYVEYEYNWRNNTYQPATTLDKILSLLHFEFL